MEDDLQLPNFDREYCRRIFQIAAMAYVGFLILALAILISINPATSYCPNWEFAVKHGKASIWGAVLLPALPAVLWISVFALGWDWFADKIVARAKDRLKWPKQVVSGESINLWKFPYNKVLTCVAAGWGLACAQPLILMGEHCLTDRSTVTFFVEFILIGVIGGGLIIGFLGDERS